MRAGQGVAVRVGVDLTRQGRHAQRLQRVLAVVGERQTVDARAQDMKPRNPRRDQGCEPEEDDDKTGESELPNP